MSARATQFSRLPGFSLTMGYTLLYLSLIVLIPLSALFVKTATLSWERLWATASDPRVLAAFKLTIGASLAGAVVNTVFGFVVAWSLVRYSFPGKRLMDALVDLPFALPTAVSGIALTAIYAPSGWVGQYFEAWNQSESRQVLQGWLGHLIDVDLTIRTAFSPIGVALALTFIGLPFVVRTVQPVLEELDPEVEESSASLGANRRQTFWRIIVPALTPALLTGFGLALARGMGEYGSVVFISGNMPMRTEIASLLIVGKLEQYDYAGATTIAVMMLLMSFVLLLGINLAQWWTMRRFQPGRG